MPRSPAAQPAHVSTLRDGKLGGGQLQPTILAGIIRRSAQNGGIAKHVTAHTLRHTAATWLREATGDARLVAEYLGHADLSTVSRYAHVAREELHVAAQALADGEIGAFTDLCPVVPLRALRAAAAEFTSSSWSRGNKAARMSAVQLASGVRCQDRKRPRAPLQTRTR